jgi:methyl-accepting chemotaxis protein
MNWGMNLKANGERKKIKHTINNKFIKNLQGMNEGMNKEKQRLKSLKMTQNHKRRTEIEHCSKSVNSLPLNVDRVPFLTGSFKTGATNGGVSKNTDILFSRTTERDARTVERDARTTERDARTVERDARTTVRDARTVERDARTTVRDARTTVRDTRTTVREARTTVRTLTHFGQPVYPFVHKFNRLMPAVEAFHATLLRENDTDEWNLWTTPPLHTSPFYISGKPL